MHVASYMVISSILVKARIDIIIYIYHLRDLIIDIYVTSEKQRLVLYSKYY